MTLSSTLTLFIAMITLALLPGPGVVLVFARTMGRGMWSGITTTLGIVIGDFIFILLAVYGLASLSQFLGDFFVVIKYLGAIYLMGLGFRVFFLKQASSMPAPQTIDQHSFSFIAGLVTTLANPKAILFYVSFLPAFIDISAVQAVDVIIIMAIAFVAVGGVMLFYAYLALKAGAISSATRFSQYVNRLSGAALVGSGLYIATRA